MGSTDKKISFGFSKISKKPTFLNKPESKKVELIECLEGQNIKIRDAVEVDDKPLVIPLKENKKNLLDRIKEVREKARSGIIKSELEDTRPDSELTIDELAARELLREAKNRLSNSESSTTSMILPMKETEEGLPPEGEVESTLEDYEKVPIGDYGLAMLRGMGWKEGFGIGKNPSKATAAAIQPELRPKGLGLGATKIIKEALPKEAARDKDGNTLVLKKGALAKVIAGSHKGQYCEVQGLDEESARVIVKTALKDEMLTVNECLLLIVTKEEYAKNSKILNSTKYEEYKEKERKLDELKSGSSRISTLDSENGSRKNVKSEKSHERTTHSENTERNYSRKTESDSDSSYESQNEKYNKVHKRKDKRRHRDRSRSPPSYRYKNGKKSSKSRHRSSSSDSSDYEDRRREQSLYNKERRDKKKTR